MANAIVKVYTTVEAKLSQLAVVDGQLIFVSDTKRIYLDMGGYRVCYTAIQVFSTDQDRLDWLAPIEGFYFVKSTGVLWNYSGSWKQLSPDNLEQVFIGSTTDDFPQTGNSGTLYTSNNAVYKWDSAARRYEIVANKTEWTALE